MTEASGVERTFSEMSDVSGKESCASLSSNGMKFDDTPPFHREATLDKALGRSKKVFNSRAGIPFLSEGDKSYHVPEYSKGFHQIGSTLPTINFSRSSKTVCDTFIPLQSIQKNSKASYIAKTRRRLKDEEKESVVLLSRWKPAQSISSQLS